MLRVVAIFLAGNRDVNVIVIQCSRRPGHVDLQLLFDVLQHADDQVQLVQTVPEVGVNGLISSDVGIVRSHLSYQMECVLVSVDSLQEKLREFTEVSFALPGLHGPQYSLVEVEPLLYLQHTAGLPIQIGQAR